MFWKRLTVFNWRLATPGKNPKTSGVEKTQLKSPQSAIRTPEQASLPPVCSLTCRLTGSSSNCTLQVLAMYTRPNGYSSRGNCPRNNSAKCQFYWLAANLCSSVKLVSTNFASSSSPLWTRRLG